MMLCHPGDQTLFISLAPCSTWLVTQWRNSPNKYSGKGQSQFAEFGLPGDLQGFVRIELVRHHSYGNSKVCDDVTFFVR